ncbi:MAG: SpoIIE family protein phosphatase [Nitrospiraceae bacterium]|nr:SpoIIE family protein phosphatase [Nitrospiraceae bacterium]
MSIRFRTRLSLATGLLILVTVTIMALSFLIIGLMVMGETFRARSITFNRLAKRHIEYALALSETLGADTKPAADSNAAACATLRDSRLLIQDMLDHVMGSGLQFERLMIVCPKGEILGRAGKPIGPEDPIDEDEIRQFCLDFLAARTGQSYRIMPIGDDLGVVMSLADPSRGPPSALFIQHSTQQMSSRMLTLALVCAVLGLVMVLLGVAMSSFLCRGLYRPIAALTDGVQQFAKGNFDYRIKLPGQDEIAALGEAFNHMAEALKNHIARLESEMALRERLESDLRVASEVQRALLPETPPQIDGLELIATCTPAREVGGDFYDFIDMGPGCLGIVVGDAAGKGLPAALLTTECSSILGTLAIAPRSPSEVLFLTNNAMCSRVADSGRFVTLFFMVVDVPKGEIRYASAGHCPPILVGQEPGRIERLLGNSGFPLGIVEDAEYPENIVPLRPNDTILLYSDGLTEAHNGQDELYGEERVQASLQRAANASLPELLDTVCVDVALHMGDREIVDDMTIVGIRYSLSAE